MLGAVWEARLRAAHAGVGFAIVHQHRTAQDRFAHAFDASPSTDGSPGSGRGITDVLSSRAIVSAK